MWVMSYSTGWSQETFLLILKRYGGVIVRVPGTPALFTSGDDFGNCDIGCYFYSACTRL